MSLIGADPNAAVHGIDQLPGTSNYLIGSDPSQWRTGVPNYAKVRYESVYPGVDLVYYGRQGRLEYDFEVAPGGDPSAIALKLRAFPQVNQQSDQGVGEAAPLHLDTTGGVIVDTAGGQLRLQRPVVYQREAHHMRLVRAGYVIDSRRSEVRLRLGAYNRRDRLIIDPVLSYATLLDGNPAIPFGGIAVDSGGNAYVTGGTLDAQFPVSSGAFQSALNGTSNVYVTKLNPQGTGVVYSTYIGGSFYDTGNAIAIDSSGDAYVTGSTSSPDFPMHNPIQSSCLPCGVASEEPFILELNSTGTGLVYSTYLGGSTGPDWGTSIAVDSAGDAYVLGNLQSVDFPFTQSCNFSVQGTTMGAWLAEIAPKGASQVFSECLALNVNPSGGIAIDSAGDMYVTGADPQFNSPGQGLVQKFGPGGSGPVYSLDFGGSGVSSSSMQLQTAGYGITADASGNAYVTGQTNSNQLAVTSGVFQSKCGASGTCNSGANNTAFVLKVDPSGSIVYASYLGGSGGDTGQAIAVDSQGDAYVTGYTQSTDFPVANPVQSSLSGSQNAFVAEVNPQATQLVYSTYLGAGGDSPTGIAVDASGNAYVTGSTQNAGGFPLTSGAFQTGGQGLSSWVAKVGAAAAAAVVLSPGSLSFSSQNVGTASAAQTVTLNNNSSAALIITSISVTGSDSGDFAVDSTGTTCSTSKPVAASGTCTIAVTFTPAATGASTATLSVVDSDSSSPQAASLSGTGSSSTSSVTVSPASLTFPSVAFGTASTPQTVTLTNNGSAAVTITNINITGAGAQDFVVLPGGTTCSANQSVAAAASCTMSINFVPVAAGTFAATLTVADSDPSSPHNVPLNGTATNSNSAPAVSISPSSLTFSSQAVGSASASQSVTITNTGNATLNISSVSVSAGFKQTNTCGAAVSQGSACTISVTFQPAAAGSQTGTLTIADNAPKSPQTVSLSGTGTGPVVGLSPASLSLPAELMGATSASQSVTLSNTGTSSLTIASIKLTGPNPGDFAETNTCGSSLAAGAKCTASLTFTPSAGGARSANLTITDNAAGGSQNVAISGMGQGFSLAAGSGASTSASVSPGQTATYNLSLSPEGGLAGSVQFSCSGAPSETTCSVSPSSASLSGSGSAQVTVSVATTAASGATLGWRLRRMLPPAGHLGPLTGLVLLTIILAAATAARNRRRAAPALAALLLATALAVSCGGSSSGASTSGNPGTPSGNYTVTVTGSITSGSSTFQQKESLTLVVN
ncbi:MAG TPA: choice-of-anchor D domain-containing protein [Terriglobia bacterium]|nr:choice-of-anchor D domain-containing protein [Terriglobia bacterium]